MEMIDERRLKRHQLIYYLSTFDSNKKEAIGHIIDIATEGAKLLSETTIPVGKKIKIYIILPRGFSDIDHFEVEAESVRNSRDINISFYDTGIRFINANQQVKHIIECLINEYGF